MTITLAIDTSTKFSSVAVKGSDGNILCRETESENSHDEELTNLVKTTLEVANLKFSDLEQLLVGSGPGSFTGLRIGFSFLKGLGVSLEIPLKVFPTFHAAAFAQDSKSTILVLSDARRKEWFAQLFKFSDTKGVEELGSLEIKTEDEIKSLVAKHSELSICSLEKERISDFLGKLGFKFIPLSNIANGLISLDKSGFKPLNPKMESSELELAEASPSYIRSVAAKTIAERMAEQGLT